MYLKTLEISNLYGKNYDLEFKNKLTILYGLNGSGKTTILNIINNLLSGDFKELMTYDFSEIICHITNERNISKYINVKRYEDKFNVHINDELVFSNLYNKPYIKNNNYKKYNYSILDSDSNVEFDSGYERKKIIDTIYLPLDRNVVGVSSEFRRPFTRKLIASQNHNGESRIDSSLKKAQAYYKDHKYFVRDTSTKIQNQIEKSMVEEISLPVQGELISFDAESLDELVEKVENTFDKYEIQNNIMNLVIEYNNLNPKDKKYQYVLLQLNMLNNVMQKISDRKNYLDNLMRIQVDLKKEINYFFQDTEKKIIESRHIKYLEDALFFSRTDKEERLKLGLLSSGEKQLIILLVFSILSDQENRKGKIFLVDEPELSLHIAWQKKLLDKMIKYGEKTQLIVATHSPDIVNHHFDKLVEVKGEL